MSEDRSDSLFADLVDSVGVKAFASNMNLSSRQVHRMLNGAQPNPIGRMRAALVAGEESAPLAVLDYLCEGHEGYFVAFDADMAGATTNAVKEAAEAIVAIAEERSAQMTVKEIREAISALAALDRRLRSVPKK